MKKVLYLFSIFCLILLSVCLVGCNNDDDEKKINLPTSVEEANQLISKIDGCIYEIEDLEKVSYDIPEGAKIELIAEINGEFILGVYFDNPDNCTNAYDEVVSLINDSIKYEFEQNPDDFEIKSYDGWIYAGTNNFVEYFEGNTDVSIFK